MSTQITEAKTPKTATTKEFRLEKGKWVETKLTPEERASLDTAIKDLNATAARVEAFWHEFDQKLIGLHRLLNQFFGEP